MSQFNLDEIFAMKPGRIMDAWVAEHIMGWQHCKIEGSRAYGRPADFMAPYYPAMRIPDFSTEFVATMDIVAVVQPQTHHFSLEQGFDDAWVATFFAGGYYAKEATAAWAICKAAALAMDALHRHKGAAHE